MDIYSEINQPPHFYIYAWISTKGLPYYIGKGNKKRAWHSVNGHRPPKDKSKIVILESNLTELGAFALERRYIKWWGRKDIETGILINRTDGGDGQSGLKFSEKTKRYLSEIKQGEKNNRYGIKHREESKEKTRQKLLNRKFSPETLLKMSIAKIGKVYEKVPCSICNKYFSKGAGMILHIKHNHL